MDEIDLDYERWLDTLADETDRDGYAAEELRRWEEQQEAARLAAPAPVDAGGIEIPF